MKKSEISSSCEKLFAGEAIVEPEARDAAIAWIPDTMRFLDTVTADDADAGVDDQSEDRKSTRLNPVTNAHLVCRLLLEKKKKCRNKKNAKYKAANDVNNKTKTLI